MHPIWPRNLMTLAEWDALPEEDWYRNAEVAEGILFLPPSPRSHHQHARQRVGEALDKQLVAELVPVPATEVLLGEVPLTVRVPDMVVVRTALLRSGPERLVAADVLLAVEILSDGTRRVDRIMKFAEYAEAGIPQYWIVDLGSPTTLLAYALVDGHYELSGEHAGTVTLDVAGHPVTLDLDALTAR